MSPRAQPRRVLALGVVLLVLVGVLQLPARAAHGHEEAAVAPAQLRGTHWVAAWAASPQPPNSRAPLSVRGFAHQTLREVIWPSVGGTRVRVRLTNRFGRRPLHVVAAALAADPSGGARTAGTAVALTFAGRAAVVIAPGREVVSDPARFAVAPMRDLAVSLAVGAATGPATTHVVASQRNAVAPGQDVTGTSAAPFDRATSSYFFLDGLSVLAPSAVRGAIVTLGDSLTDGFRSTIGANARWPNDLARRLGGLDGPALGVVDAGIAGNRLLSGSPCYGPSALDRVRDDVIAQPGVRAVIVLEGINDIVMSRSTGTCSAPHRVVSAAALIAADQRLIRLAHAARLKIFAGTLLPFRFSRFWSPAGEATREAVNRWIRTSGAFDGVFDFASAVADPSDDEAIAARFDSGDHLHLDDAGYRALAGAVALGVLLRG